MLANVLLNGFLLLPILAYGVQASAQDKTANPVPDAVGEYTLTRANSQPLPAVVSESGAGRQEVIGGSVQLQADGTYVWSTRYRFAEGGRVRDSESSGRGRYSQQGTNIIFSVEVGDDRFEGTLEGDTLTIQADVRMVYRRI